MRTKCICRHRDYNCVTFEPIEGGGDEVIYLLGGKWDDSEPLRVKLPYMVKFGWDSKLNRHWLNQNCEGWYDLGDRVVWFERDTDALLVQMVWG